MDAHEFMNALDAYLDARIEWHIRKRGTSGAFRVEPHVVALVDETRAHLIEVIRTINPE